MNSLALLALNVAHNRRCTLPAKGGCNTTDILKSASETIVGEEMDTDTVKEINDLWKFIVTFSPAAS